MLLHRMHLLPAAALASVTLAASMSVLSQPLLDLTSGNAELEIVDRLAQIESQQGPRSPELIGPLRTLALLYQESGDHALAAAAVDRAWDLVRIHHGVQSLDQAALIGQRIEIAKERGDLLEAWNLEQTLLVLARRHSDDARTVGILHRIGDERMSVLERYVDGEFPPQIVLGCYYAGAGDDTIPAVSVSRFGHCTQGFRGVAIRSILWEAQMHYSDAIKAAIANDLYSSGELRELEMKLVRSSFLYGAMYEDGRDYLLGRESLRRLAAYEAAVSAPPFAQIEALVRIADWDILFSRGRNLQESALAMYELAYRRLSGSGENEAAIAELFSPEMPIALPAFLPNRFALPEAARSGEYVDLAFEVTREGRSRNVEILRGSTERSRAIARHVNQLIRRSRFRPRLVDGQFADSPPILVRYYLPAELTVREDL